MTPLLAPHRRSRHAARLVCALAALGLLALLAPAGVWAAQLRGVQLLGLRPDTTASQVDTQLDIARRIGARTVRVEASWADIEPQSKGRPDQRYLGLVDHFVSGAAARGIRIVMVVDGTPCWASSAPEGVRNGCGGAQQAQSVSYPPSDPADYAAIAGFLAGRYAGRLAAFEVWNEPDHYNEYYFRGPDKPQRYAAILRAAYPAIKSADASLPVLAGSLVGADGRFLRALYAQGIQGSYDGLAIHYYTSVLASIRAIRQTQSQAHDSKPLWLTEFGWSSCLPHATQGGQICVDAAHQGIDLADVFSALRNTSYVRAAIIYNLQDDSQYNFGLVRPNLVPKPAFNTVSTLLHRGPGPVRPISLRLRRSGGRVLASISGPAGDALELQGFRGRRFVGSLVIGLDRYNRFTHALPGAWGTRGLRVRVYQYWSGVSATRRI
ncbi:MAG TPA: glycosyl hydrolase [Solirubrobacteraceae bacterium]|jgi:hypothetical protein|nr:glycosyl hydrolase [Solirubrobacteraceae bacterium]